MKEAYLHYIWKTKSFNQINLTTLSGQKLQIIDFGIHNLNEGGPDFLYAKVAIDDVMLFGHVEIHVDAKEWFSHQHHQDPAYDNVILHVVFKGGARGPSHISTLELDNRLNYTSYNQWLKMSKDSSIYPCRYYVEEVPEFIRESLLFNAFLQRMNRKVMSFQLDYGKIDDVSLLKILCAKALGSSVNGDAFVQWAQNNWINRNESHMLGGRIQLKSKGVRPGSHPKRRLIQLRWLFENWQFMSLEIGQISNYRLFRKQWLMLLNQKSPIPFTSFVVDQLFINALLPVLYRAAQRDEREDEIQQVIHLYHQIPAEKNTVIDKWNKELFQLQNAIHSQGALEWTRFSCATRQCLNCSIGHRALQH